MGARASPCWRLEQWSKEQYVAMHTLLAVLASAQACFLFCCSVRIPPLPPNPPAYQLTNPPTQFCRSCSQDSPRVPRLLWSPCFIQSGHCLPSLLSRSQQDTTDATLQALVYDILPSTTAVFSYAIGSRKLLANEQFFCWCSNSSKFVTNNSNYARRFFHNRPLRQLKTKIVGIETELSFYPGWMSLMFTCVLGP